MIFAYALIHDFWITMMSNFLIAESRKNDVIITFLNLCTLYCRINNFLLMFVVSRFIARKMREIVKEFMIVWLLCRRHFLEIDLVICRFLVFAWIFWLLMLKSECWRSLKDKEVDNLISLKTYHCKKIWLSNWWLSHTSKHFWSVDQFRDVRVQRNSVMIVVIWKKKFSLKNETESMNDDESDVSRMLKMIAAIK
jgi:hypothetical protein